MGSTSCQALQKLAFGAGWDHDSAGNPKRPRPIRDVRQGKIALLTTIPHWVKERLVIGAFLIKQVKDDPNKETYLSGEIETSLDDMIKFSIPFWKYHKNPNKPESTAWGQGLFRYVSDVSVLGILEAYRQGKLTSSGDTSKVDKIIDSLKASQ